MNENTSERHEHGRGMGSNRIAVDPGAEPADWQEVYDRLERRSRQLSATLLKGTAAGSTLAVALAVAGLIAMLVTGLHPDVSPYILAAFIIPPGLLAGAAAGQAGGNLFLRHWYGLDDCARRGFATRLTLARAPAHWPVALKRWLFTGDWLGSPAYDLRLPYLRIFIDGPAPLTCREEEALWEEVHALISGDARWEAGSNHREISYPRRLPGWARKVRSGDGFAELAGRIGAEAADEWVRHLWKRACRQWPGLGADAFPGETRKECFEIHSLLLANGREALAVILRPASFVAEMDLTAADRRAA